MNTYKKSTTKDKPSPIMKEDEVKQNPDPRIDQDYPGFPHAPSHKKNIKPSTDEERKLAGVKKRKE